jgi:hypothetical protein
MQESGNAEIEEEYGRCNFCPEQGKQSEQGLADKNRTKVQDREGKGNAEKNLLPGVAGRQGHGRQLGLVSQFRQKYYAKGSYQYRGIQAASR